MCEEKKQISPLQVERREKKKLKTAIRSSFFFFFALSIYGKEAL